MTDHPDLLLAEPTAPAAADTSAVPASVIEPALPAAVRETGSAAAVSPAEPAEPADPAGVSAAAGLAGLGELTPTDLATLLTSFNEVTSRLESTHSRLRAEVVRLRRELHEANEQLQRSKRLAALGEMAAGISHEIRNPLGSIQLYAKLLEDDLAAADLPEQHAIAGKIAGAVRGLDGIVTDVLSFAREIRLRPEPVTVRELIAASIEACEEPLVRAEHAGAPIRIEGPASHAGPGEPDRYSRGGDTEFICDRQLMVQALVNIVRNAIEAMAREHTPGRLVFGVRTVVGGGPDRDDAEPREATGADAEQVGAVGAAAGLAPEPTEAHWLVLSIRDTGPGIPAEVRERMFNPFFTTRATGTGLGLAIVHRIIDAHGGRVEVTNVGGEPGRGGLLGRGGEPGGGGESDRARQAAEPGSTAESGSRTTGFVGSASSDQPPADTGARFEFVLPATPRSDDTPTLSKVAREHMNLATPSR